MKTPECLGHKNCRISNCQWQKECGCIIREEKKEKPSCFGFLPGIWNNERAFCEEEDSCIFLGDCKKETYSNM